MTAARTDSDIVRQFQLIASNMACCGLTLTVTRDEELNPQFFVFKLNEQLEPRELYRADSIKELAAWYEGFCTDPSIN